MTTITKEQKQEIGVRIQEIDESFTRAQGERALERQRIMIEITDVDQIAEPGRFAVLKVKATRLQNQMNDERRRYDITRRQLEKHLS